MFHSSVQLSGKRLLVFGFVDDNRRARSRRRRSGGWGLVLSSSCWLLCDRLRLRLLVMPVGTFVVA